jgi:hypothetical protein
MGLNESLPSGSEVLVLFERDPYRVHSCWNVRRKRSRTRVEIKRGIDGEPKNVRQLTSKIVALQA